MNLVSLAVKIAISHIKEGEGGEGKRLIAGATANFTATKKATQ